MEDVWVWIFWAAIIVGSMVSSASKAKKKREEEARRKAKTAGGVGAGTVAGSSDAGRANSSDAGRGAKPGGRKSLSEIFEELARQANEQPSPPVVIRPLSPPQSPQQQSQPVATSHDYYSLEGEYDAMDGREYRGELSAEVFEDEVAAYERLATQRAQRSSLTGAEASIGTAGLGTGSGSIAAKVVHATAGMAASPEESNFALTTDAADNAQTTLRKLLGGEFDLRRAVIEAEILTPKYV